LVLLALVLFATSLSDFSIEAETWTPMNLAMDRTTLVALLTKSSKKKTAARLSSISRICDTIRCRQFTQRDTGCMCLGI